MITFIITTTAIGIIFCLYVMFKPKTDEEKEYEKNLEKSLEDEHIIDPITGEKLKLVQTSSGEWVPEKTGIYDSKELTKEAELAEQSVRYLNTINGFDQIEELNNEEVNLLNNSKILSKYNNWTYSNPLIYKKGKVFLPAPEIYGSTYYEDDYIESQLMFWIKISDINGHYYLRPKSKTEQILDKLKKDDDLHLKNYECFTIKSSFNIIEINRLLKPFERITNFEIEIHNDMLMAKTDRLINIDDIKTMENIINNIG